MASSSFIKNIVITKVQGDGPFFGMRISKNNVELCIPETYCISNNGDPGFRNDILSFLSTISLTRAISDQEGKIYNEHDENNADFALYSYLWLIHDYLENGICINREKTLKRNSSGRVNWKKTLQQTPIISNGNIIFNDLIMDTTCEVENIIVEAHKLAVKRSLAYIGWLFNLSDDIIEMNIDLKQKEDIYLYELNKELNNTFDDIKKLRIKHIINVLLGLNLGEGSIKTYGANEFNVVYEKMVDDVFSTVKAHDDKSLFMPYGTEHIMVQSPNEAKIKGDLKPDTILISNKTAYILDSKWYRFGVTGLHDHLPAVSSTQKQITYGDYINSSKELKAKYGIKKIRNAFLIPFDKQHNNFNFVDKDDPIQFVGYNKPNWRNGKEDHLFVNIFLIDLKTLINEWSLSNHQDKINLLTQKIEDALAKIKTAPNP